MDQLSLTSIGMLRLYLLVKCWLICLREKTIAYATAQLAKVLHQSFIYPRTWSIWIIWTINTLNLSNLQAFQHFSLACEIQFLKTCPIEVIRFLSECIVNLLQGNLSEVKRSHVLIDRGEIHQLTLERTTWKQRRSLFLSQRGFLFIKTISPFVINRLYWDGTVCSSTSFGLQQQQQPTHSHKTRTTQLQAFATCQIPQGFVKKRN